MYGHIPRSQNSAMHIIDDQYLNGYVSDEINYSPGWFFSVVRVSAHGTKGPGFESRSRAFTLVQAQSTAPVRCM